MLRLLALTAFVVALPTLAAAQQARDTPPTTISSPSPGAEVPELGQVTLPGPGEGEQRTIYYWRPPNAPPGPLPVLYMGDGLTGLMVAAAPLRPLILSGQVPPIIVVGVDPNPTDRTVEYALPTRRNEVFNRHFIWFTDTVIPWAEMHIGASNDRAQRGVGGFSNSADFAITAGSRRPDLFSAVLAHSPVNVPRNRLDRGPGDTRWALTAGHVEYAGDVAQISRALARHIGDNGIVRRCLGHWPHDLPSWRAVSPGTIVWLFNLGDETLVETEVEREHCRNG